MVSVVEFKHSSPEDLRTLPIKVGDVYCELGFTHFGCPARGGSELSGKYELDDKGVEGTIEFRSDHKVHMVMDGIKVDGEYVFDGTKVTLQFPGGKPVVLSRVGNTLERHMDGYAVRFNKK